ncbi:cell division ATPase MinD [Haladaptatus caseinilyticus]|uniref:cell division ATPase MinD n=1 Tax=Haladaptatus caseinilyticus TaxID=2993314 RepID=UPI00224AA09C|nr:cell division ATPase MinD [Haladaptatus caseinilyticus]
MTGTVYAVASGKGGVGKTTTAINLGAMLAAAEHEVIVVDTDLGMANVEGYLDFDPAGSTLHEVLAGEAAVEEAIYDAPGNIDVLPSSTDIHAFAQSQTAKLQQVVAQLRETYEYVLLDTGAGISYDTILPLSLADRVLLVTTPDVAAVRDTAKTAELTARVDGTVRGAVLTQRSNDILNANDVEGTLDTDVLTVVPDDETVPLGIDAGRPLAVFAPNASAATAYRELADILTGETDTPELSGEPNPTKSSESMFVDDDSTQVESDPDRVQSDAEADGTDTDSDIPDPDPVHDLIDRRVIKTDDTSDDGEPTVEAVPNDAPATVESTPDGANGDEPAFETSFDELDAAPEDEPLTAPVDPDTNAAVSPSSDSDDSGEADSAESASMTVASTEADTETTESDTAIPDSIERPEKSTTDGELTAAEVSANDGKSAVDGSPDLPDEIVEAEPERDEDIDAVPFQNEPVRPELDTDEIDEEDGSEGNETNGLFGRIGSLFR